MPDSPTSPTASGVPTKPPWIGWRKRELAAVERIDKDVATQKLNSVLQKVAQMADPAGNELKGGRRKRRAAFS